MARNWWNFTGLRCSGMSRLPITLQILPPRRLRPSWTPCRRTPARGMGRVTSRRTCCSADPTRAKPLGLTCLSCVITPSYFGAQPISQRMVTYAGEHRLHDRPDDFPTSPERHRHRVAEPTRSAVSLSPQWPRSRRIHPCGRALSRHTLRLSWCSTRSVRR